MEGVLADKSQSLVLEALTRAVAEPGGLPMFATKAAPGLFTNNAAGKQAAEQCKSDGLFQVLKSEPKGKTVQEICAITEKGLALLLGQANPRQVLESFI